MRNGLVELCLRCNSTYFYVPNNRVRCYLICSFLSTSFILCCGIILMQPKLIADFLQRHNIFKVPTWGTLYLSGCGKHQSRWHPVDRFWKNYIMVILFKWVQMMIRFVIWVKKGPLFLFWVCLDFTIFHHGKYVKLRGLKCILWYCLEHISSFLELYNFGWSY